MDDDLIFNLTLEGIDGKKVPFRFTRAELRDLLTQILSVAAQAPLKPDLDRKLILDEHPIPANGFMVTRLADVPGGGHVSIGVGPIDLQFAVSLDVLMQALEVLKGESEPGPTSSHRPN